MSSENKNVSLSFSAEFLKKHDNFIILTHSSPDGDTLGSAFALYYGLKSIGKRARVMCPDKIPAKYSYFTVETDDVSKEDATVVAVDVADENLLGALKDEFSGSVDLCVDHHISNTGYAKNLLLDAQASAVCETIYELLIEMGVALNDVIAKALYTGIVTDTGCFKYANVTAKTHIIASKLLGLAIDAADINRLMFDTKSKSLLELERMVLETAEYHFGDKCILLCVTEKMQKKTGCSGTDLEGIAVISRSVEGVLAGITVKQTGEEEFKISLRTFNPLDASAICKTLGGGGHKNAAGVTLKGNLKEVKKTILEAVEKDMEKENVWSSAHK